MSAVVASRRLLVVGAGRMGSGIAAQAACAGWSVSLVDSDPGALERAQALYEEQRRERFGSAPAVVAGGLDCATELEPGAREAEVVVEAVSELLEVKREIFTVLGRLTPSDTLLTSNSSAIRVSAFEDAVRHPERLLNMHFFPPVAERPLVELMAGTHTSADALSGADAFARSIGMTPVMVLRPSTGFMFNRVWRAIKRECLRVVDLGIGTPEDIDRAWMIIYGLDEGPFGSMDAIGLDVVLAIEEVYHRETGLDSDRPPQFLADMVAAGRLGVKAGAGFYRYPDPTYREPGFVSRGASRFSGPSADPVVGTWRLTAFVHQEADGAIQGHLFGEAPLGCLTYNADGHFHLNVMRDGRRRFAGPTPESGDLEERAAAFSGAMSYAGTWSRSDGPDGPLMTHHVEISSFPNWIGSDLVRRLRVTDRDLVLTATPPGNSGGQEIVVTWEREDPGASRG
jgi:3-hydroxybutyryl-CoA dehydrogenase